MSAISLTIPGAVPNPFLPLDGMAMPTTVQPAPTQNPIILPSGGQINLHFAAIYSESNTPPTTNKLFLKGNLQGGAPVTATALGPFDWKKTADGDYITVVQFNYDDPLALTGPSQLTATVTGDGGEEYSFLADSNDLTTHFKVFHGTPSNAQKKGYLPTTPLTQKTPYSDTATINFDSPVTLKQLTVFTNVYISTGRTPRVEINGASVPVSGWKAASSPFLSTMGELTINFSTPLNTATVNIVGPVLLTSDRTALGGLVKDSSGKPYYTYVDNSTSALGAAAGRPVGPVTSSCPNCYDIHCPIADMGTGNCATSRVETTADNAIFSNKCTYGGNNTKCWEFTDMDTNVGIYINDPHRVIEANQYASPNSTPSVNYYIPEFVGNTDGNAAGNVYKPAPIACVPPPPGGRICQAERDSYLTYEGDGSEFNPFCPKMTTPTISDFSASNGAWTRSIRCLPAKEAVCNSNGYSNYRNTCIMNPPLTRPVGSSDDVCTLTRTYIPGGDGFPGYNRYDCSGSVDNSVLSNGWTSGTCENDVFDPFSQTPTCKVTFTNSAPTPMNGQYYWKKGTDIQNFIESLGASECLSPSGCSDQIKTVTLTDDGWKTE